MAEWFKAAVLKTAGGASSPWVRILLPPLPFRCLISGGAAPPPSKARATPILGVSREKSKRARRSVYS
jgi:hypothetical protein